jgi:hypothetical protein
MPNKNWPRLKSFVLVCLVILACCRELRETKYDNSQLMEGLDSVSGLSTFFA